MNATATVEALQVDERIETITTRGVKLIAATLSEARAEALERAAIVAGLLPLPASSCFMNFAAAEHADEEGLTFTGYGPKQISPARCYVRRKPNMFVTRAKRLPALANSGTLRMGTDESGWWFVEVSTSAGVCRCVAV